jgi:propane monooxygenase reductase subunit
MITKKYNSIVTSISNTVPEVYTIEFKSLIGKYRYLPGQFLHLALDTEYDGISQWPESRCFSMQSNPDEETIRITYAVKGRFTKMMEQQLKVGSEVWLKLPYGNLFTQPHNKVNTVFIAGGTGITPFLSLFTHASFNEYINPCIYLGFRSKKYNIYHDELSHVQTLRAIRNNSCNSRSSCNSSQFVKYFYEDIDGQLDIQHILSENGTTYDYFISGPPVMIKSFTIFLIGNDVHKIQIKTDDWE